LTVISSVDESLASSIPAAACDGARIASRPRSALEASSCSGTRHSHGPIFAEEVVEALLIEEGFDSILGRDKSGQLLHSFPPQSAFGVEAGYRPGSSPLDAVFHRAL